ncbi:hypothetical protein TNCV_1674601 [Trichonephila clavipes]|nr:hypothetical protein TNCV_1674601 [Trichonephila clavipes]
MNNGGYGGRIRHVRGRRSSHCDTPCLGVLSLHLRDLDLRDGHACSHPRVPRAHQAGLSRRSFAGAGLSESVRCRGTGLALLTNGGVQQQQQQI